MDEKESNEAGNEELVEIGDEEEAGMARESEPTDPNSIKDPEDQSPNEMTRQRSVKRSPSDTPEPRTGVPSCFASKPSCPSVLPVNEKISVPWMIDNDIAWLERESRLLLLNCVAGGEFDPNCSSDVKS